MAAHLTEELLEQVEQVVVEMVETAHLLQHPQVRQIKVLVEVAGVLPHKERITGLVVGQPPLELRFYSPTEVRGATPTKQRGEVVRREVI